MNKWPMAKLPFLYVVVWSVLDCIKFFLTHQQEQFRGTMAVFVTWAVLKVSARLGLWRDK